MKLVSLIKQELVFFGLEGRSREEIYENLLEKMSDSAKLPLEPHELAKEMIGREDSIRMVYDKGFAFPHLRHPDLQDMTIAIGIPKTPVRLKANDITETRLIICCLVSESTSVIYLKTLAAIAKHLRVEGNLDRMISAGTPKALLEAIGDVIVQPVLTAENVMSRSFVSLSPDDKLAEAVDIIASDGHHEIPVLDKAGLLLGKISVDSLIRKTIPEYVMMLENLNFLKEFEPFEALMKEESKLMVKDVMEKTDTEIKPEMPLIQLTVKLLKSKSHSLYVVEDKRLVGIITMIDLMRNVLRG